MESNSTAFLIKIKLRHSLGRPSRSDFVQSKFSYKKVIVIKLNRFEVVSGKYIEEISGQSRIGYSMSDTTDFYDMIEWSKKGGYQGSIISFYDYNNGKIYEPFQKQRNVLYGPPVYLKNSFWFLQGDYNSCKLRSNGMPVPLLRNGYSIFNGTKYR